MVPICYRIGTGSERDSRRICSNLKSPWHQSDLLIAWTIRKFTVQFARSILRPRTSREEPWVGVFWYSLSLFPRFLVDDPSWTACFHLPSLFLQLDLFIFSLVLSRDPDSLRLAPGSFGAPVIGDAHCLVLKPRPRCEDAEKAVSLEHWLESWSNGICR